MDELQQWNIGHFGKSTGIIFLLLVQALTYVKALLNQYTVPILLFNIHDTLDNFNNYE